MLPTKEVDDFRDSRWHRSSARRARRTPARQALLKILADHVAAKNGGGDPRPLRLKAAMESARKRTCAGQHQAGNPKHGATPGMSTRSATRIAPGVASYPGSRQPPSTGPNRHVFESRQHGSPAPSRGCSSARGSRSTPARSQDDCSERRSTRSTDMHVRKSFESSGAC